MKVSKRLATRSAAIAGACLIVLGLTASPSYAVGCHDAGCAGWDPVQKGCSWTSSTSAPAKVGSTTMATVWNRYAWNCNANWGRAQLSSTGVSLHYKIFVEAETFDRNGKHEFMCFPGINQNQGTLEEDCKEHATDGYGGSLMIWGDMVDGTNNTAAYVVVVDANGNFVTSATACQIGCP
jgi:hypothetical protein